MKCIVFITKHCSCHAFLLVHHELGEKGPCLQQWSQVVFLQLCGICLRTSHQLSFSSDSHPAASPRLSIAKIIFYIYIYLYTHISNLTCMQKIDFYSATCFIIFFLLNHLSLLGVITISNTNCLFSFQLYFTTYFKRGPTSSFSWDLWEARSPRLLQWNGDEFCPGCAMCLTELHIDNKTWNTAFTVNNSIAVNRIITELTVKIMSVVVQLHCRACMHGSEVTICDKCII